MDPEDVSNLIENRLYHLRPSSDTSPCVVKVQVKNIGSWVIKIRNSSVIVNDRSYYSKSLILMDVAKVFHSNLIFEDCANINATISFKNSENFWNVANSSLLPDDTTVASVGNTYIRTGDIECVNSLLRLLSQDNTKRPDSKRRKSTKEKVIEGTKSFKSGWLHKKRDIIAGWRHRYFKVYMGRVEYYTDQSAVVPRGVIPLLGADIVGPIRCTINGNDDHWCLT